MGKQIEVRLYEKGFFSDSELGMGAIELDTLRYNSGVEGNVKINGKKPANLEFGLYLREPLEKFSVFNVKTFLITK